MKISSEKKKEEKLESNPELSERSSEWVKVRIFLKKNSQLIFLDKAVSKFSTQEEQKQAATEEAPRRKSLINKKIIGDVKIFNSETLNPTAYIPINPKVRIQFEFIILITSIDPQQEK